MQSMRACALRLKPDIGMHSLRFWRVEDPEITDTAFYRMGTERQAAIKASEAVRPRDLDGAPGERVPVDPVVTPAGVGNADRELVAAARYGCVHQIALERKFSEDRIADEHVVEIDLGSQTRAANGEKYSPAAKFVGNVEVAPPPGDPAIGTVLRHGVRIGPAIFVGGIGPRPACA